MIKSCRNCYYSERIGEFYRATRLDPPEYPEYPCRIPNGRQHKCFEDYETCAKKCKYYEHEDK